MLRRAKPEDLEALVAGNYAMALETEDCLLDEQSLRAGVRSVLSGESPAAYWVVESESGKIEAQLMITYEWSDWRNALIWWIQSVYVAPEARGRGRFKSLYQKVREEAEAAGAAGLRLYVEEGNVAAMRVYEALGMAGGHYRVYEDMFA